MWLRNVIGAHAPLKHFSSSLPSLPPFLRHAVTSHNCSSTLHPLPNRTINMSLSCMYHRRAYPIQRVHRGANVMTSQTWQQSARRCSNGRSSEPSLTTHRQTFPPLSHQPSRSAPSTTTPSPLLSSARSSVTPTAQRSAPTLARSSLSRRRPRPPRQLGAPHLLAPPSRHTVLVRSSTLPVRSATRVPRTSAA